MKNIINAIAVSIVTIVVSSCNKASLIEGFSAPTPTVISINKTISLYGNAGGSPNTVSLIVDGYLVSLATLAYQMKATAVNSAYAVGDSVRKITFAASSGYFNVNVGNTNYFITRYAKGATMGYQTLSVYTNIIFSKRVMPYTSNWVDVTNNFYDPWNGITTPISNAGFLLNSDNYISLKLIQANGSIYYGWIHLVIGQNSVTFDKFAYQKSDPLAAGQEE